MCDQELRNFLGQLDLLSIAGYEFERPLGGGGSSVSAIYRKSDEQVVFKFLIAPRNDTELERFKLEYSFLKKSPLNAYGNGKQFFLGPETSYPVPTIKHPLQINKKGLINYFSYNYEEGELLSELNWSTFSFDEKVLLLHRIASALSYFSRSNYDHRDLHPENILLRQGYDMDTNPEQPDPRVVILDLGNCQVQSTTRWYIRDDCDEDAVIQDNNRRLLTSFVSMPPDFLVEGKNIQNYDTWAFGIFAYNVLFDELPFEIKDISDLTKLRISAYYRSKFAKNIHTLPVSLRKILERILSLEGKNRPPLWAIVKLLYWVRIEEPKNEHPSGFIEQLLNNDGNDPRHNPIDECY
ncbi:protein kinase [Vibrio cyclitrophicus]